MNDEFQSGGIVDLSVLKDFKEKTKNARENILRQNGLLCPCGKPVRDQGVTLFVYKEEIVGLPGSGNMSPAVMVGTVTFHSSDCSKLLESLQAEDLKPIALREAPRTTWLDEGIFADNDENIGNRSE